MPRRLADLEFVWCRQLPDPVQPGVSPVVHTLGPMGRDSGDAR